jgi:adenine phosphoribosyltransferase
VDRIETVKAAIRTVPDFPKPGILFYDITTILQDPAHYKTIIELLAERYASMKISKILAMESRGFIFAGPLATIIDAGLVPLRKPGKLPAESISESFELEYGTDSLEMHVDAVEKGERVLVLDDLLATGGTADASIRLARKAGAEVVEAGFVIELSFLNGRDKLGDVPVYSMIQFDE